MPYPKHLRGHHSKRPANGPARFCFAAAHRTLSILPELLMVKRDEVFQRADAVLVQGVLATQAQLNVKAPHGISIWTRIVDLAGFVCVDRQDTAITTTAFRPLTAVKGFFALNEE
jgi:hypothetical protein